MKVFGCALVATVFLTSGLAAAQDSAAPASGTGVAAGQKSLSFAVPAGGSSTAEGTAGLWMMAAPNMNLGLNVGLAFANKPETNWDLLLAPAIRYYCTTDGAVLPFYYAQANIRLHDDGNDATDDDVEFGVAGGMGAEWFVVNAFSISGWVGAGLNLLQQGGSDAGMGLGTLTSGLSASIYY